MAVVFVIFLRFRSISHNFPDCRQYDRRKCCDNPELYSRFSQIKKTMKNQLKNKVKANHLVEVARLVYQVDPLEKGRVNRKVMARSAILVQLRLDGELLQHIGDFLNISPNSTVCATTKITSGDQKQKLISLSMFAKRICSGSLQFCQW